MIFDRLPSHISAQKFFEREHRQTYQQLCDIFDAGCDACYKELEFDCSGYPSEEYIPQGWQCSLQEAMKQAREEQERAEFITAWDKHCDQSKQRQQEQNMRERLQQFHNRIKGEPK